MTLRDDDDWLENADIVIDGEKIVAVGQDLVPDSFGVEKIMDGKNRLITPGLVNAHLHSFDRFDIGRFDNLPLEVWWALFSPPIGKGYEWTARECYLRTILNCLEMLKTGTTMVIDDVIHGNPLCPENIDAVFQAYQDVGMRAQVSIHSWDKPYCSFMPYLEDILPANLKEELAQIAMNPNQMIDLWRSYGQRWRGRVQFILAASGPQRCSDEFMKKTWSLSKELDLPVFTHVLETKVQAVTGREYYGESLVEHMKSLGVLTPKTTLIHAVWVTDNDIELISEAGSSVVHNPISNLKLGSGIAPIRKMLDFGINIGIGTDNNNGNDTANMFEAIKVAALLHKVSHFDYDRWVGASEVIRMATRGGARCGCLHEELGYLSTGMKADLVLYDLNKLPFIPRNNLLYQLVFCEHGESVNTVIVDGNVVVEGGRVINVDEQKLVGEVMERVEEIQHKIRRASARGGELEPYFRQAYFKCVQQDIGFSAYSGSEAPRIAQKIER